MYLFENVLPRGVVRCFGVRHCFIGAILAKINSHALDSTVVRGKQEHGVGGELELVLWSAWCPGFNIRDGHVTAQVPRPIHNPVIAQLRAVGHLFNAIPTRGEVIRELFVRLTPPLDRVWCSELHSQVESLAPLVDEGAAEESLRWHMHRRPKLRIENARDRPRTLPRYLPSSHLITSS